MDGLCVVSTQNEITSLVRGWLKSPSVAKTDGSPLPPVTPISPRPERLGLGAVSVGGSSGKTGLMFSEAVFRKTRFSKENARSEPFPSLHTSGHTKSSNGTPSLSTSDDECSRSTVVLSNKLSRGLSISSTEQVIADSQLKALKRRKKKKRKMLNDAKTAVPPIPATLPGSCSMEAEMDANDCGQTPPDSKSHTSGSSSDSDCVSMNCKHTEKICDERCMQRLRGGSSDYGHVPPTTNKTISRSNSDTEGLQANDTPVLTCLPSSCHLAHTSLMSQSKQLHCKQKCIALFKVHTRRSGLFNQIYRRNRHTKTMLLKNLIRSAVLAKR